MLASPHLLHNRRGFTLVELLLSMTVLSVLLLLVSSVLAEVQKAWTTTQSKVSQFREARRSFELLKRNLQQATLNPYQRFLYNNPADPFAPSFDAVTGALQDRTASPTGYVRYSELQFRCGEAADLFGGATGFNASMHPGHAILFQAPLGNSSKYPNLPTALNGRGYFVEYGSDAAFKPPFVASRQTPRFRYRLMEYAPPSEANMIYDQTSRNIQSDWYQDVMTYSRPVADNVVFLVISPKRALDVGTGAEARDIAPEYAYDSNAHPVTATSSLVQSPQDYELPPALDVVMAVLDEGSAAKICDDVSSPPIVFPEFNSATGGQFNRDIDKLEEELMKKKVNFRLFHATIPLRNSRWSG